MMEKVGGASTAGNVMTYLLAQIVLINRCSWGGFSSLFGGEESRDREHTNAFGSEGNFTEASTSH